MLKHRHVIILKIIAEMCMFVLTAGTGTGKPLLSSSDKEERAEVRGDWSREGGRSGEGEGDRSGEGEGDRSGEGEGDKTGGETESGVA